MPKVVVDNTMAEEPDDQEPDAALLEEAAQLNLHRMLQGQRINLYRVLAHTLHRSFLSLFRQYLPD